MNEHRDTRDKEELSDAKDKNEDFSRYTTILNQQAQSKQLLDPLIKSEVEKLRNMQEEVKKDIRKETKETTTETVEGNRLNKKKEIIKL